MAIQKWLNSCEKSFYSHLDSLMGPMLALCSAITPSELQDSKDFKLSLHPLVRRLGSFVRREQGQKLLVSIRARDGYFEAHILRLILDVFPCFPPLNH